MKEKHRLIIDQIGRNILGKEVSNTDTEITLHNPIILHFQPSANGQLELQVFPLFFFELLDKDNRDQNSWTYAKSAIAVSDAKLSSDLLARYTAINTPKAPAPAPANSKVISIDDV